MIYEVMQTLRVRTPKGETELTAGQMISLDSFRAQKLVEIGKLIPYVSQTRCASLTQCMDAIWETHALTPYKQGFRMTPAIERAEKEVERLQAELIQGKATLEVFSNAMQEVLSQIRKVNLVN